MRCSSNERLHEEERARGWAGGPSPQRATLLPPQAPLPSEGTGGHRVDPFGTRNRWTPSNLRSGFMSSDGTGPAKREGVSCNAIMKCSSPEALLLLSAAGQQGGHHEIAPQVALRLGQQTVSN